MPMGADLLKEIVGLTHYTFDFSRPKTGDHAIFEALKIILAEGGEVTRLNEHMRAARQLGQSADQALSIDNVIDALEDPKIELIGKLGITRAIWKAESGSHNFSKVDHNPDSLDINRFSGTWYSSLTKLLTENVRRSGIDNIFDNLTIVNFNYDRCLEHYLPFSLASYYGVNVTDVRKVMPSLTMYRPYGQAGRLPWQQGQGPSVQFGGGTVDQLAQVAPQIRTFTERLEDDAELGAMREAVSSAERIVFLGFAFHRQNVELISSNVSGIAEFVATAYQISESDKSVIGAELAKAFEVHGPLPQQRIELADMECREFFKQYWRTLTAGPDEDNDYNIDALIG